MIDQQQQRDHAEEAAVRAELESEGAAELLAEQEGAVRVTLDPYAGAGRGVTFPRQAGDVIPTLPATLLTYGAGSLDHRDPLAMDPGDPPSCGTDCC